MSKRSLQEFRKIADCVAQQYASHCYGIGTLRACIDGNRTLPENIADNGGLTVAYDAFQHHVKTRGEGPPIPALKDYTLNRTFFLSYAQLWCESYDEESLTRHLDTDPHSPADARVSEVVKNMPEFSLAFGCRSGDPMMPDNRCEVGDDDERDLSAEKSTFSDHQAFV